MAYDEILADRIRKLLVSEPGLSEKKMFGGLAFLINGNMAIAASCQGGILVHVDPGKTEELIQSTTAQMMEMRGRSMKGWLRVATDVVNDEDSLAYWAKSAVDYAGSLPPKTPNSL